MKARLPGFQVDVVRSRVAPAMKMDCSDPRYRDAPGCNEPGYSVDAPDQQKKALCTAGCVAGFVACCATTAGFGALLCAGGLAICESQC
jgi:hypothetical protein